MRVQRGEKILNELVAADKISPSGKDWLLAAIDPFHDNQLTNLTGWPDMESGASVVRCVKQTMQISQPSALSSGNWDCHIMAWPMLTSDQCTFTMNTRNQNHINGPAYPITVPFTSLGGVQVFATPPNTNLTLIPTGGSTGTSYIGGINLDPSYTKGSGRLIGMGFEIHNTTAELSRQGSITVYRMLANARDPSTFTMDNAGSTPYQGTFMASVIRHPPVNANDAILLYGGRTWEAEEGCYVVCAFNSTENPGLSGDPTTVVIASPYTEDMDATLNTSSMLCPTPENVDSPIPIIRPQRVHPIHQSGAILQGLSKETTLTLNVNFYYESFPGLAEKDILVLANPSARFDPCVMEFYSRIVQTLPMGVPVAMNGLGDWFLSAATQAAKYIGPVLAALPHPIAKGAGAALTYLGNTGDQYVQKQRKRKEPKSQQAAPPNVWKEPKPVRQNQSKNTKRTQKQPKSKPQRSNRRRRAKSV